MSERSSNPRQPDYESRDLFTEPLNISMKFFFFKKIFAIFVFKNLHFNNKYAKYINWIKKILLKAVALKI